FFLLLFLPCPPCSTLFPYTTLFRSLLLLLLRKRQQAFSKDSCLLGSTERLVRACTILTNIGYMYLAKVIAEDNLEVGGLEGLLRDRKSTRLNSSHLGISYAVFCLKK